MKIVAISDTHGQHERVKLPKGDLLIHAGDVSSTGGQAEVAQFLDWFAAQPFTHKVMIAGNHDFFFEHFPQSTIDTLIPPGIVYLNDSGVTVNGLKIWGSPITPWFYDWAFNRRRGEDIKKHWDLIPTDTDILVTHGPVSGILDENGTGEHTGCKNLFARVLDVKPKVHICGHIHEAYGTKRRSNIRFINASLLNERYELVNKPVVFNL